MVRQELRILADEDALAQEAARLLVSLIEEARGKRVSLGLSGGSTPRKLYEALASPPWASRIPWSDLEIFWSDERLVPPDHPDSNYRMANEALLSKVSVPSGQIHPLRGKPPRCEEELRGILGERGLDILLLGVGEDGHTASLFPGSPALEEKERWVAKGREDRLTLTLPLINRSAYILVLVSSRKKAQIVQKALSEPRRDYPIQRARARKRTFWLLDRDAAGQLDS